MVYPNPLESTLNQRENLARMWTMTGHYVTWNPVEKKCIAAIGVAVVVITTESFSIKKCFLLHLN